MTSLLSCNNITRTLGGEIPVTLVKNAKMEIKSGEFVAITGPSGSGKSSLLYLLGLLDKPTSGEVWVNGVETTNLNEDARAEIRLAQMGFVFQFHFLLPEFTAAENILLPMKRLNKIAPQEMIKRAQALLDQLDLGDKHDKIPKQLSGGQAQRVAIARALANKPKLILADEPTGNLDTVSSDNVQQILQDLAHNQGHGVLVVTHDPEFAKKADRIIHIVDGSIQD